MVAASQALLVAEKPSSRLDLCSYADSPLFISEQGPSAFRYIDQHKSKGINRELGPEIQPPETALQISDSLLRVRSEGLSATSWLTTSIQGRTALLDSESPCTESATDRQS